VVVGIAIEGHSRGGRRSERRRSRTSSTKSARRSESSWSLRSSPEGGRRSERIFFAIEYLEEEEDEK
jgi:hypothetical protein